MASPPALPARLDRVGVFMSAACAVHCALMPFVAGLLPLIGLEFLAHDAAEITLLVCAAIIAAWSLAGGCRHHKQLRPIGMMVAGFGLILLGQTVAADAEVAEIGLVVVGALFVAGAHLTNRRLCCAANTSRDPSRGR